MWLHDPSQDRIANAEKEFKRKLKGEVRFDTGSRALYATDASNYRHLPLAVVLPKSVDDLVTCVELCRRFSLPLVHRGGGTSLAGQTCNEAVVIDSSKYCNRVIEIDEETQTALVEPGVVLDHLNEQAGKKGLIVGPDPATHTHCTLGGMIGNNSCGVHAQMSGRMEFNVAEMEVLTYRGARFWVGPKTEREIYRILEKQDEEARIYRQLLHLRNHYKERIKKDFPRIPRRISGYNLEELLPENQFNLARALVGTESTCATVLRARIKLLSKPKARALVVIGFKNVIDAAKNLERILHFQPLGLEGIDQTLKEDIEHNLDRKQALSLLPDGRAWLYVEFGGENKTEAGHKAEKLVWKMQGHCEGEKIVVEEKEQRELWKIREAGLGVTAHSKDGTDTWEGWEDAAVPPKHVAEYLQDFKSLLEKYDYQGALYGHFGQGCIHTRINFDLRTEPGIQKFHRFLYEGAELVHKYNGSLSGEHGDGQARAEFLPVMYPKPLLDAFQEFKRIWDPDGKMNPGKVVNPESAISHLRLGSSYNPADVTTHFRYPEDQFSFSKAMERCVGVGKCRSRGEDIMCPSYRATNEEKHSTRGRARLLFEMLNGREFHKGWKERAVKESLDLCLACKGCKTDCPVKVDMATYKAEFMAHYYKRRLRPRAAYSMGMIPLWAPLGGAFPRLTNFLTQTRGISPAFKFLGGISRKRKIPSFAVQRFVPDAEKHANQTPSKERVVLWPDTFNQYFYPEVVRSAYEVLRAQGFEVVLPEKRICCGRPYYDYGMLKLAKNRLSRTLEQLKNELREGSFIVGLEPSCVAVFRDELPNLFPHHWDAKRLSAQTHTFSEFLKSHGDPALFEPVHSRVHYHGHCHHRAVMGIEGDVGLLQDVGFEVDVLKTGCCGMAGSFGFEAEKYDVSVKVAESEYLPHLKRIPEEDYFVADGFSCREQAKELSEKPVFHSAELLRRHLKTRESGSGH